MKIKRKIDSKMLLGILLLIMASTADNMNSYEPFLIMIGTWIVVYRVFYHLEKRLNKTD